MIPKEELIITDMDYFWADHVPDYRKRYLFKMLNGKAMMINHWPQVLIKMEDLDNFNVWKDCPE